MSRAFDSPNYNPRYGLKNTGKVREEDFSIDGRSWDYRDPQNADHIRRQRSGWTGRGMDPGRISKKSYEIANPLYDYDYGTVRDAAKALEIGNVDEQKEVDDILEYIQGGSKAKEEPAEEAPEVVPYSEPDPRITGQPSANRAEYDKTRLTNPGNETPGPTYSNDPMKDSMNYGNALTKHYEQKFIPSLIAEAKFGAEEIGDSTRWHVKNFVGKVPELGDPRAMLEYYEDKVFG